MFRPARARLLCVAVGVYISFAFGNALAQSHAEVIQQLQSEGTNLREKLDKLDKNSQTILTLQDEKAHLPYAEDVNKGADHAYANSTAKKIDEEIEKLKRENGLLRKEVNAGLAYVVSLAISTIAIQEVEDSAASQDKRAAAASSGSIVRSAAPGHTVVAPMTAPSRPTPIPPGVRAQTAGAGTGAGDSR